jgi:hypothetical protein
VEKLQTWKEKLEELGYYKRIDSIAVLQKDEDLFLELLVRRSPRTVRMLIQASPEKWEQLFPAVDEILKETSAVQRDLYIDATYSGKILVRTESGH